MKTKLEITVEKTVEAIARIERFVVKYGSELNDNQKKIIIKKNQELQNILLSL
jgi:hypothetical protein